jgi:hypothetical protein
MCLCPIEGIFEQGVVQRPEDERPGNASKAFELHLQNMTKSHAARRHLFHVESVRSEKPWWCAESKTDAPPWLISLNGVANRTVAAQCTDLKGSIEAHRRPAISGPERIVR